MKHRLRNVLLVLIPLLLIAAGAVWYGRREKSDAMSYRTVPVTRGDVIATISATGTVEPEEVIDVGAQVAGRINEFGKDQKGKPIDYGSEVEAGTTLALIDPSVYQSEVDQAKAQLESAQAGVDRATADLGQMTAKYNQAQRDWERAQKLGPSDAMAQVDYDAYQSAYEAAKATLGVGQASVEQAKRAVTLQEATLTRAQQNLGYCTITAPVKGVIIDRRVNIGQTVVSSLSAPSLFLIAKDLTRMQVWASVNEADIGNIHPGQEVSFTVDTYPNRTFKGSVGKVRLNATMTQNVVTYTVEIITDNADRALLPYLTANVSFQVNKHENVMLVPNAALRWSPTSIDAVAPEARAEFETADGSAGGTGSNDGASASAGAGAARQRGGAGETAATSQPASPISATTRRSGRGPGGMHQRGMIWAQDGNFVKPIHVRLGVTDGVNTEVQSDELKEGQAIVVGEIAPGAAASSDDAKNPFAPQFRRRRSSH
jgi:HlyD family secretion protein